MFILYVKYYIRKKKFKKNLKNVKIYANAFVIKINIKTASSSRDVLVKRPHKIKSRWINLFCNMCLSLYTTVMYCITCIVLLILYFCIVCSGQNVD